MNSKHLFVPMALIGACLVGTTAASAAFISFSEDPNDTAPIAVTTDIPNATITVDGVETAGLLVGSATSLQSLLFETFLLEGPQIGNTRIASDEVQVFGFASPLTGERVGLLADDVRLIRLAGGIAGERRDWRFTACNTSLLSPNTRGGACTFVGIRPIRCRRTGSHRRCWTSRPDLGERWPSRLVATAEEDCCLNIRRHSIRTLLFCGSQRCAAATSPSFDPSTQRPRSMARSAFYEAGEGGRGRDRGYRLTFFNCARGRVEGGRVGILFSCLRYFSISSGVATP
jgi:hypothetical protein